MEGVRSRRWVGVAIAVLVTLAGARGVVGQSSVTRTVEGVRLHLAVRLALLEALKLDGLGIGVDVTDGTVLLTGTTRSADLPARAEAATRAVAGVRRVTNRIVVESGKPPGKALVDTVEKGEQRVADAVLGSRVKLALIDALGHVAFTIDVRASQGVVTLEGRLPSVQHRDIALRAARSTKGVTRVVDRLDLP